MLRSRVGFLFAATRTHCAPARLVLASLLAACARPTTFPTDGLYPAGPDAQHRGVQQYRITNLHGRPTVYQLWADHQALGEVRVAQVATRLEAVLHLDGGVEDVGMTLDGDRLLLTAASQEVARFDLGDDGDGGFPACPLPPALEDQLPLLAAVLADDSIQGNYPVRLPWGELSYRSCPESCANCGWCGEQRTRFTQDRCALTCWRCLSCVKAAGP